MTRLTWDAIGERYYEIGVDRGVLYVNGEGHAWPGLVSVAEAPVGGDPRPYYIDGYKYMNIASAEEFEATIQAFSAPEAFAPCEGVNLAYAGLLITQQPRKSFDFSYRTKVGNDVDGSDHAYKVHLVYNALAGPSGHTYESLSDSSTAPARSWKITSRAPKITNFRPTAHFVIDSRTVSQLTLVALEDFLYGTNVTPPAMPTVAQLLALFEEPAWDGGGVIAGLTDTIIDGGAP